MEDGDTVKFIRFVRFVSQEAKQATDPIFDSWQLGVARRTSLSEHGDINLLGFIGPKDLLSLEHLKSNKNRNILLCQL